MINIARKVFSWSLDAYLEVYSSWHANRLIKRYGEISKIPMSELRRLGPITEVVNTEQTIPLAKKQLFELGGVAGFSGEKTKTYQHLVTFENNSINNTAIFIDFLDVLKNIENRESILKILKKYDPELFSPARQYFFAGATQHWVNEGKNKQ